MAAYVLTSFCLEKLGRRLLTAGPLIFSGVCMIFGMLLSLNVSSQCINDTPLSLFESAALATSDFVGHTCRTGKMIHHRFQDKLRAYR